jgi:3-phenylpropionate/trans-cinnamate dioxygenase ferredoxin reductase subunit
MKDVRVVIVGAGQAGGEAARRLRQNGFEGVITLIGAEPVPPYQRPPLSKAYLKGEAPVERLLLRPVSAYADDRVELITSAAVAAIERHARVVTLDDGRTIAYDKLILATGARPRALHKPGAALRGVHAFRTLADADALRASLKPGARVVIVGAGYIGLEAAAAARQIGADVTLIESAQRPLARVTSAMVADFFLGEHMRQGVRFILGAQIVSIEGAEHVSGVALSDGATVPADVVIVGIGVTPEAQLAEQCGLAVENGVVTDMSCRTSDPDIFAIGDCAARPMVHFQNRSFRLESVHNAVEGARVVAAEIAGVKPPAAEAPWFWSDQYDLKLQIAGLSKGHDHVVLRGATSQRSFAAFYYQNDRLIAVDAVNRPAEFLVAKSAIQMGSSIPGDLVSDESLSMKQLAAYATKASQTAR